MARNKPTTNYDSTGIQTRTRPSQARLVHAVDLTPADIPSPDAPLEELADFAASIDGYALAGSLHACAAIAADPDPSSILDQRLDLYFHFRAMRHCDDWPETESDLAPIRAIVTRIRELVTARDRDGVPPEHRAAADVAITLDRLLGDIAHTTPLPDVVAHSHLDEAWFSDRLAWLLDPAASHDLGDRFLRGFLDRLAAAGADHPAPGIAFARQRRLLRAPYPGAFGTTVDTIATGPLGTVRELHLGHHESGKSQARHSDLAVVRLTGDRPVLVAIENKLFTTDHDDQLAAYQRAIESRYADLRVVEYAYLTLFGQSPTDTGTEAAEAGPVIPWVPVSWVDDVLPVLEALGADGAELPTAAAEVRDVLRWFAAVRARWAELGPAVVAWRREYRRAVVDMLLAELQRLNDGAPGTWHVVQRGTTVTTLGFSRTPARTVAVRVLDNLAIAVMARVKSRGVVDQRVIPAVSDMGQLVGWLGRTAVEVYSMMFGEGARRYRGEGARGPSGRVRVGDWSRGVVAVGVGWRSEVGLVGRALLGVDPRDA